MSRSIPMVSALALLLLGASTLRAPDAPPKWWQTTRAPAIAAPPAEGVGPPLLDDTWWRLKLSAKGYEVDPEDGATTTASHQTIAYMHVVAAEGGPVPVYTYDMYTEIGPDAWSFEFGDDLPVDGFAANGTHALLAGAFFGFDQQTTAIGVLYTGRLSIKLDKEGVLKSAKFKTLVGELVDSTLDTGKISPPFYGSAKVTGTLIDADELPFTLG